MSDNNQPVDTFYMDKNLTSPTNYRSRTPVIFESGKFGEQAYDIYSWLALKKKVIFIDGVIDDEIANALSAQLIACRTQAEKEVELFINSPGGSVRALFTMLDAIDMAKKDNFTVKTTCVGLAASAAAILLMSGSAGHRSATKRSTVMLHDISSGAGGTYKDMEIALQETNRLREELVTCIKDNTKIKNIDDFMDRDVYLDPFEAIGYGVIDKIKEDY